MGCCASPPAPPRQWSLPSSWAGRRLSRAAVHRGPARQPAGIAPAQGRRGAGRGDHGRRRVRLCPDLAAARVAHRALWRGQHRHLLPRCTRWPKASWSCRCCWRWCAVSTIPVVTMVVPAYGNLLPIAMVRSMAVAVAIIWIVLRLVAARGAAAPATATERDVVAASHRPRRHGDHHAAAAGVPGPWASPTRCRS